jgi:hypothetical protein|tara:strand:- start:2271 stop:2525 length:255 start_codon:yes stop_codon:yes gene_type:complete
MTREERLPDHVKEKLEDYLSGLESRIDGEKRALELAGGGLTGVDEVSRRAVVEPIARTITAYEIAYSNLLTHFPELEKDKLKPK